MSYRTTDIPSDVWDKYHRFFEQYSTKKKNDNDPDLFSYVWSLDSPELNKLMMLMADKDKAGVRKWWEDTDLTKIQEKRSNYNPLFLMAWDIWEEEAPHEMIRFAIDKSISAGKFKEWLPFSQGYGHFFSMLCCRREMVPETLEYVLKNDPERVCLAPADKDASGYKITPLHGVALSNNVACCKWLLKQPEASVMMLTQCGDYIPLGLTISNLSQRQGQWSLKKISLDVAKLLVEFDKEKKQTDPSFSPHLIYRVCGSPAITEEALKFFIDFYPKGTISVPSYRSLAIHQLCMNDSITPALLKIYLDADQEGAGLFAKAELMHDWKDAPFTPFQLILITISGAGIWWRPTRPWTNLAGVKIDGTVEKHYVDRYDRSSFHFKHSSDPFAVKRVEELDKYRSDLAKYNDWMKQWREEVERKVKQRPKPNVQLVEMFLKYDTTGKCILDRYSDWEEDGGNSMHYCVNYNMPEILQVLIRVKSAQKALRMTNKNGDTPDVLAQKKEDAILVASLSVKARAQLPTDATPEQQLKFALKTEQAALIGLLATKDLALFRKPLRSDGANALSLAVHYGEPETFLPVLQTGGDNILEYINASTLKGRTLIEQIITKDAVPIMSLLLKRYPDIMEKLITLQTVYSAAKSALMTAELLGYATSHAGVLTVPAIWDLSNQGLSSVEFPPMFANLDIEEVNLAGNSLTSIPLSVFKIGGLKRLNMHGNKINEIRVADVAIMKQFSEKHRDRKAVSVDLSSNRLQVIPPEIYTLFNFKIDTVNNPLATGITWPAWFFGIRFTRFNLLVMDSFFLFIILSCLLVGALFNDRYDLRIVIFLSFTLFFVTMFLTISWIGLVSIPWVDQPRFFKWLRGIDRQVGVVGDIMGVDAEQEDKILSKALAMFNEQQEEEQESNDPKAVNKRKRKSVAQPDQRRWWQKFSDVLAVFAILIEFPTVFAFSFQYGGWPQFVNKIMNVFLLNFNLNEISQESGVLSTVDWNNVAFNVGFWLAVTAVLLQRLLFELSRYPVFTGFATTILSTSMDLTGLAVFVQLVNVLDCTYVDLGNGFGSASVDNEAQVCWEGYHIGLVCVSMLCFILFYPMAALSTPIWVNRSKDLTIRFPSYFLIISFQLKFVLAMVNGFFTKVKALYLTINIVVSVALFILILVVSKDIAKTESTGTKRARIGKIGVYFCSVMGAIASTISAEIDDEDVRAIIFWVLLAVDVVVFVVCVVFMIRTTSQKSQLASQAGGTSVNNSTRQSAEMIDIKVAVANDGKQEKKE